VTGEHTLLVPGDVVSGLEPSELVLTRLLVEKGIFTNEEFLEMVKVVDREMNRKRIF